MQKNSNALDLSQFESRKQSHLDISLRPEVQAVESSSLEQIRLDHDALPDLDFSEVDLTTPFLTGAKQKKLQTPFYVSGMTAGHASAKSVNERLAQACAKRGWIFGVGSQRRELDTSRPAIDSWSSLKSEAPGLVILGNLGLAQAITASGDSLQRLAKNLSADAFCIHLNALQEAIQPEGTPSFKGGLKTLRTLSKALGVPLILKETGCGLSAKTLEKIRTLKILAVDVSGLGGTHWGRIEGVRAGDAGNPIRSGAAETFKNWGIPTAESVILAAKLLPKQTEIWASGGVRSGLDAAKLISLGATRVGFAKPALEAALQSSEALEQWMEKTEFELRTALFCTGNRTPTELRKSSSRMKTTKKKGSRS